MIEQYIPDYMTDEIIAWGSGGNFERFFKSYKGTIRYIVDNDERRWGTELHGIQIMAPKRLEQEGRNTVIVICSLYYMDIIEPLQKMGFMHVYRYGNYASADFYKKVHETATAVNQSRTKKISAKTALIIQGPFVDYDITEEILKYYNTIFKNDLLIASTWDTTDQKILQLLNQYTDYVVLSKLPAYGGIGNVNFQTCSTANGIKEAVKHRAQIVAKTRSNSLLTTGTIFNQYMKYDRIYDKRKANQVGMEGRLLFWIANRHIRDTLFFIDDYFMMGYAEDMLLYWDVEPDLRPIDHEDFQYQNFITRKEYMQRGMASETYLPACFCNKIHYHREPNVISNNDFYRNFFVIVEKEIEFSYKYPLVPNKCLREELILNQEWLDIYDENNQTILEQTADAFYEGNQFADPQYASQDYSMAMQNKSKM